MNTTLRFVLIIVSMILYLACNSNDSSSSGRQAQESASPPGSNQTQASAQQPTQSDGQAVKLYPVDEGPQDSSFIEFRKKLLAATNQHNTTFILAITDPEIINGADIKRGVAEFKEIWKPDESETRLWETLTQILLMGGSFRENEGITEFCAPYVTSRWASVVSQLPENADPLDYEVIIDDNVSLRSAPNVNAPVVAILSYDVVRVHSQASLPADSKKTDSVWLKVSTLSGEDGYVPDKYIRSASDYQACFKKVGKVWVMTQLAARE